jgi:hypothetical protein
MDDHCAFCDNCDVMAVTALHRQQSRRARAHVGIYSGYLLIDNIMYRSDRTNVTNVEDSARSWKRNMVEAHD